MQTEIDHAHVAAELLRGWHERCVVAMPSRTISGFRISDALAVAELLRTLRSAVVQPVGYKVGFTNAAVRAQFDATAPLQATIYHDTLVRGHTIAAREYLGPRIEPEVVVGLGGDGIAWAALAFEIVQSHAAGWNFG